MDEINPVSKFLSPLISLICSEETISVPGIVCGTIWGSFPVLGLFAAQFGDHLRYWDHLRAGIICGAVQYSLLYILLTDKPTDKHQYLLHSSSHPYHTKKAIPYSLALRLRRISSKDEFFDTRSTELERYLTKRGYKSNFVRSQTYNPALPNIYKVLRHKQPILHSTERLHEIFKETPVVAYRRSPNLRDILVRAKLQSPATAIQPNHSFGTFRCKSKHGCLTCPHIDNARTNYTFNNTGEVREIKQQMTCKSKNLIYMIERKRCKKQHIGETKRTLRERFTEHRHATNNPSHAYASAAVPTHLNLPDHSIEDMTPIPLELQPTPNTSRRKAREAYLIHRGQTLEPSGMNRRNEH